MWRYSRISDLDLAPYQPVAQGDESATRPGAIDELLAAVGPMAALVIVRNGHLTTGDVRDPAVTLQTAGEVEEPVGALAVSDLFGSLNAAYAADPLTLRVADGANVADPVVVVNWLDQPGAAVFPSLAVRVGTGARATIVEIVASADLDALAVPLTNLDIAAAANVSHLNLQVLGEDVWQVANLRSEVGNDATFTSMAVALGGSYARLRTDCALVGRGATGRLRALYFGAGRQRHDFRTVPDHQVANTTSDLLYKGAVANSAHAVYSGLIRVEKGARGTNAFQTNRNLVLHEGAQAYSVPDLEIKENDVRCSHASAIGPIDEDQRFYLESRGVPTPVADRLITLGFLDEVLVQLPVAGLVDWLRQAVALKLARADRDEARAEQAVGR